MGQVEALSVSLAANVPTIMWGDPGIGKTAIIEKMVKDREGFMYLFLASQRDPVDLTGAMHPAERNGIPVTRYSTPEWVVDLNERASKGQYCVLFLDEFSTASPMMQGSVLTLIQSRKAGEYALHPDVRLVLAANPPNTAAGGYDLRAATANRLCHIEWSQTAKGWAEGRLQGWPSPKDVHANEDEVLRIFNTEVIPLVSAYVNNSGQLINIPKAESEAGRAWPSPRTWEMAAKLSAYCKAANIDPDTEQLLMNGAIGPGAAIEYLSFVRDMDLPDPEYLLANPDKFKIPTRQDQTFAILGQVVACVINKVDAKRNVAAWDILSQVATAKQVDLAAAHARTLAAFLYSRKDKDKLGDFSKHLRPFIPMLQAAGLIPGGA